MEEVKGSNPFDDFVDFNITAIDLFLALDAKPGPRQGGHPFWRNIFLAVQAHAIGAFGNPGTRIVVCGYSRPQIAGASVTHGISENTLRKHFRRELETSKAEIDAFATSQLLGLMRDKNLGALCFYLKMPGWVAGDCGTSIRQ
jgi:hypothetical protein